MLRFVAVPYSALSRQTNVVWNGTIWGRSAQLIGRRSHASPDIHALNKHLYADTLQFAY